jgi:hypothetical protein
MFENKKSEKPLFPAIAANFHFMKIVEGQKYRVVRFLFHFVAKFRVAAHTIIQSRTTQSSIVTFVALRAKIAAAPYRSIVMLTKSHLYTSSIPVT